MNKKDRELVAEAIRQMELAMSPEGWVGQGTKFEGTGLVSFKAQRDLVTYWSSINTDDSIFHNNNQYCHAGLNSAFGDWEKGKGLTPRLIVHRIMWENNNYRQLGNKVVDKFLQWLTKSSPYAKVFVTKGGEPNRKRGYLVARTNVPANLMAGALFAARMLTEHYGNIVLSWHKLVERGVPPSIAFVHAHSVSCKDHDNIVITGQAWHVPLNGGRANSKEYVLNFANGVLVEPMDNYIKCKTYTDVHDLWGYLYGDEDYSTKLHEFKQEVKQLTEGKPDVNPFKAGRLVEKCPIDPFMDRMAAYLIDRYAEREEEEELNAA